MSSYPLLLSKKKKKILCKVTQSVWACCITCDPSSCHTFDFHIHQKRGSVDLLSLTVGKFNELQYTVMLPNGKQYAVDTCTVMLWQDFISMCSHPLMDGCVMIIRMNPAHMNIHHVKSADSLVSLALLFLFYFETLLRFPLPVFRSLRALLWLSAPPWYVSPVSS